MSIKTYLVLSMGLSIASCSSGGDGIRHEEKKIRQIRVLPDQPQKSLSACVKHTDCDLGQVCDDGICTDGECTNWMDSKVCISVGKEERGCCEPWETCSSMNSCFLAAGSPVGSECSTNADCSFGKFCSSGNCYDVKGRTTCTSSFQCSANEKCDLQAHLCVIEKGGCQFCARWPELCCESTERCDIRTDRCVRVREQECNQSNVTEVCRRNQICYEGRCVQCVSDQQCGPGTKCDLEQGVCYSVRNRCSSDVECAQGQRCLLSERLCVVPRCETDAQCQNEGSGMKCDQTQFKCVQPR